MQLRHWAFLLTLTTGSMVSAGGAQAASLTGLGGLGTPINTFAFGVSADGSTVVGRSTAPAGQVAAVWTSSTGLQSIGDLPGGQFSSLANDASANGAVVVGQGNDAFFLNEAFRYDSTNGMVGLGFLSGATSSQANAVSDDGTKVAGLTGGGRNEAFIWDATNGMQGLGDLPGGAVNSQGSDISADGSTVVGRSISTNGIEAFVWDSTNGMQGLGDLPGGTFSSFASGVSANGTIVVGRGTSASGLEAFVWDSTNGMQGLGDLAGGSFFSEATDLSANGSVVVGRSNSAAGQRAFIWDSTNGMRELSVVLATLGVDLTGWTLTDASGISADGLTIVGTGTHNGLTEGFIAVIPEPGTALLMGLGLAGLAANRRRRD